MTLWHLTHRNNIKSILEKGLTLSKRRGKASFTNRFGGDLRRHKNCIYAWEHSSDALHFCFGSVGGWQDSERVLICFDSDAERIHDEFCEGQEHGRAIVIHEAVPASKIKAIYHLTVEGYYKTHHERVWQHKNVPMSEPCKKFLAVYSE